MLYYNQNGIGKQFIKLILLITFFTMIVQEKIYSQNTGMIYGKISDKSNNEELIGANILIDGSAIGAATDIDGKYQIKNLAEGEYTLKISYISYQSVTIEKVKVTKGLDTKIDVLLLPASAELEEVVITAEALKTSESNLLKIQKNSANIVDGLSAELIKKNNSSDGTDILKRMTGVTITDGKYAFVRGVGDRYNNTLLNGSSLPSTDPEKKSFSYDIFPASLIENVITAKTFTPDKPADFAGGLVQITTIEFPNQFTSEISLSSGINTQTTFKDFSTYAGGKTDYLGIDDGTRDYPSIINSQRVVRGNYSDAELRNITSDFTNNWKSTNQKAPLNGSFKLTAGDKFNISTNDLIGYVASFTYANSFVYKNIKQKNFYDYTPRYNYSGANYNYNVMWSGMLNLSYKYGQTNKLSFKNLFNQNSDDETIFYKGDYRYADQYREITSLRFVSRSLLSSQIISENVFDVLNGLNTDFTISYSQSDRNEPDGRRYIYYRNLDDPKTEPLRFQLDQSLATRYYGKLNDKDYTGGANFNLKPFASTELPKLKLGFLYNVKDRAFDARNFGFKNLSGGSYLFEDSVLQRPVQEIFSQENITTTFVGVTEITKPSDSYSADQKVGAGYLMFDSKVFEFFRLVAGARFEYSNQVLNSFTESGQAVKVNNIYRDWLPSLNLSYFLSNEINLRLAYSTTLARPEFRELAPLSYFDFVSNELVKGNPDLIRTLINNYDFRFEYFPHANELVAFSIFYKKFNNPIEEVLLGSTGNEPTRSYANAIKADNYGIEFEVRKSLSFLTETIKDFSFVGNVTLINSKIQLAATGIDGRSFQETDRPLQGQADYIFNLGLYYDSYDLGLNSSLVYNKVGNRIAKVGSSELGNVIEKPVDLIDFSISKKIFDRFALKFTVKDLLNQERTLIQQAPVGDRIYELSQTGRNVSIDLSYQIN